MQAKSMIMFPAALLLLAVFGGLCLWGISLLVRKFGAGKTLFAAVLLLPALAIGLILLSLVSYRSHSMQSAHVQRMQQIERIQNEQQMARVRAEHAQRLAEAKVENAHRLAQAKTDHGHQLLDGHAHSHSDVDHVDTHPVGEAVVDSVAPTAIPHSPINDSHIEVQTTPAWATLAVVAVVAMLGLAGMIGASVFLAAQGGTLQWRAVGAKLLSLVWVIPAVAIAAVPMYMIAARLDGSTAKAPPAIAVVAVTEPEEASNTQHQSEHEHASGEFPDWVTAPPHYEGQDRIVVVASKYSPAVDETDTQRAIAEAQTDVYQQAVQQIRSFFGESYPIAYNWPIPDETVRRAIGRVHLEEKELDAGGKVYRRFAEIRLTPQLRQTLLPQWQKATVNDRLWSLCAGLGLLTLLMGTAAGYLRLDSMTNGAYRGRLKLASLSVVTAGALAAGMFLA